MPKTMGVEAGAMLEVLGRAERALPRLLAEEGDETWESLDVDYEPPRVERLWRPWGEGRLYLHWIHPCEEALYHPHPWASGVKVLEGRYEMRVGYLRPVKNGYEHEEVMRMVVGAGTTYEMLNPWGLHSVKPLGGPSLSIMVTGRPWPTYDGEVEAKPKLDPLSPERKAELLKMWRERYPNMPDWVV